MKTRILVISIIAVVAAAGFVIGAKDGAATAPATKSTELKTDMEKVSYIIGTNVGRSFKQGGLKDLQYDAFVQGIKDIFAGKELALNPMEMQAVMKAFGEKMKSEMDKVAAKNAEDGKAFLAENAKKEGVVTLPSGLQYKVITEGKGKKLKSTDKFKAFYKGTLIDGTVFDQRIKGKDEPLELPVTSVVRGWTEALQLMPIGSKWIIYLPSDLAYGPNPRGEHIGPNSALIFEMELVGGGEDKK